jgi:hypothetical protein
VLDAGTTSTKGAEPLTISNCDRVKTVPASAAALGEPGEPGDGS